MNSTMTFSIDTCEYKGCHQWHAGSCMLNGFSVKKYWSLYEFFSDGSTCQARNQIDKIKTRDFLEGK